MFGDFLKISLVSLTCSKSLLNPSTIDLQTNRLNCVQNTLKWDVWLLPLKGQKKLLRDDLYSKLDSLVNDMNYFKTFHRQH